MRKLLLIILICSLITPVSAAAIQAPQVPERGENLMPEADTFGEGLLLIIQDLLPLVRPDLFEASRVCLAIIGTVMIISLLQSFSDSVKLTSELVAAAAISAAILLSVNSMIRLAGDTISEMTEYGKLLLPVLTAALAAQGAVGSSAALYSGTAAANTLISTLIAKVFLPIVYLFLAVSVAAAAIGDEMLKKFRDMIKSIVTWCLKTILTVFTTYMTITGVISGTTDTAALKAAKATISSVVPVVGGILSDASEAVLISVGLAKNAAGLYGIFAILAVFLEPFLLIGCHYLLLKLTAAVCGIFGPKNITDLIGDFSTGMGLLLAMTGSVCLLLLISSVCFLKGVS